MLLMMAALAALGLSAAAPSDTLAYWAILLAAGEATLSSVLFAGPLRRIAPGVLGDVQVKGVVEIQVKEAGKG